MNRSIEPGKPDPEQSEIARGTPPARTPENPPETDLQPGQTPVRDTPEVSPTEKRPPRQ